MADKLSVYKREVMSEEEARLEANYQRLEEEAEDADRAAKIAETEAWRFEQKLEDVALFCILSTCRLVWLRCSRTLCSAGYGLVVMMMMMDMMGVARAGCPGWWWCVTRHLGHPCPGLGEWPGPHSWWQ